MATDATMVIPEPEAAPEEGKLPSHFPKRNNLAGDQKLCDDVRSYLGDELENYRVRNARTNFVDSGGVMDNADRAWRVALRRDTTSDQHQDTLSDVADSVFHRAIRALTAGENAVFFQGQDLPARYEANLATGRYGYAPADGEEMARKRNLVRDYTWEQDDRRLKIKQGNLYKNKYGQQLWGIEWAYETEEKWVKEPVGGIRINENGEPDDEGLLRPDSVKRVKKKVVTKEWPTLVSYDLRSFYADPYINCLQDQRATLQHFERGWEWAAMQQSMGYIMNMDKVTTAQTSKGETDEQLEARRENAGETPEVRANGLLNVWECWARLPIKEFKRNGKLSGRGKIDKKEAPQWYWCTFIGGTWQSLRDAICVRLVKNPYNHGKLPLFMDYAYHDDKGMYHVAPWNLVEATYWQIVTNINQAIDNVTLRTRAPYTLDGPCHTRDLTFKANKVIRLGKGTTLTPIDVPRTTEITMEMKRELEEEINKALGITQTIQGIPLGGRTSAFEAENDLDQAMKPLMQKADENGQAFYSWLMEMDAELWDQFARPELSLVITHNSQIHDVKPAEIYGAVKVKVTAVTEFENTATRRRELNGVLQSGAYDRMAEVMPAEGKALFWRKFLDRFGFTEVMAMIPPAGDLDAARVSAQESWSILFEGAFVAAQQGENHAVHLSRHESFLREYEFLPEDQVNPEAVRNMRAHIEQHKAFQAEISQRQAPTLQEGSNAAVASNAIEAQDGAVANL